MKRLRIDGRNKQIIIAGGAFVIRSEEQSTVFRLHKSACLVLAAAIKDEARTASSGGCFLTDLDLEPTVPKGDS